MTSIEATFANRAYTGIDHVCTYARPETVALLLGIFRSLPARLHRIGLSQVFASLYARSAHGSSAATSGREAHEATANVIAARLMWSCMVSAAPWANDTIDKLMEDVAADATGRVGVNRDNEENPLEYDRDRLQLTAAWMRRVDNLDYALLSELALLASEWLKRMAEAHLEPKIATGLPSASSARTVLPVGDAVRFVPSARDAWLRAWSAGSWTNPWAINTYAFPNARTHASNSIAQALEKLKRSHDALLPSDDHELYEDAFERFHALVLSRRHVRSGTFEVVDRLLIGTSDASAAHVGMTLDCVFGAPMIPGEPLKNVARRYLTNSNDLALSRFSDEERNHVAATLFGDTRHAGLITFEEGWILPADWRAGGCISADVLAPHHSNYHAPGHAFVQEQGQPIAIRAPAEHDKPVPIPHFSVRGRFRIAISAHGTHPVDDASTEAWLDLAWLLLTRGLKHLGIGARKRVGYGRLDVPIHARTTNSGVGNRETTT